MTDLKLLSPDQPTPLERRLLDAVANESPSEAQRLRVRQALGLTPVSVAPPAPPPKAAQTGARALLAKAAAGGLVVVSTALWLMFSGGAQQAPSAGAAARAAAPVAAPSAAPKVGPVAVAEPSPPIEAAPIAPAAAAAAKPAVKSKGQGPSPSSQPSAGDGSNLSEQLRLIEAARAAVAARQPSAAATALSSYRSRFPRGAFGQEATVLQIQTVDLQGNHARAATLAQSFLAQHPNSPHVGVVRRIANR